MRLWSGQKRGVVHAGRRGRRRRGLGRGERAGGGRGVVDGDRRGLTCGRRAARVDVDVRWASIFWRGEHLDVAGHRLRRRRGSTRGGNDEFCGGRWWKMPYLASFEGGAVVPPGGFCTFLPWPGSVFRMKMVIV